MGEDRAVKVNLGMDRSRLKVLTVMISVTRLVCKYGSLNEGTFALAVAKFVYDKHTLLYDTHLQIEADVEINRGVSMLQTLWRSLLCSCGICDMGYALSNYTTHRRDGIDRKMEEVLEA